MGTQIKTASGISLAAGLWLMFSAFFLGVGFASSEFVVGLLIALFSLTELFSLESSMWISLANGLLGIWLLLAPLFFVGMSMGAVWNSIILGVVVLALSIWSGMASSTMGHGHPKMG